MTGKLDYMPTAAAVLPLAERALIDFELMDAFQRRPSSERDQCLRWIEGAGRGGEERARVAELLDSLAFGDALPGAIPAGRLTARATRDA